eukprot:m.9705 g.9705  ORF g.9705 m.9705 type:complete len:289 (+) comp4210_c0_seq1:242-1108(+)
MAKSQESSSGHHHHHLHLHHSHNNHKKESAPVIDVNVRDVATVAAGLVRPGTLFRASEIFNLPEVKTVIDLRGGGAILPGPPNAHRVLVKFITPKAAMKILWGTGPTALFPAAASKVQGDSFKVAMAAKTFKYLGLRDMYRIFVTTCQHEIKKAVVPLADAAAFPAVIHCTHGKDRTGVVIGLLLTLVGVSKEAVLADYGRSAKEILSAQERGEISDEHAALQMKSEYITSDPADLRDSLFAHLEKKHLATNLAVSARQYLVKECKVSQKDVDSIIANLKPRVCISCV